MGLALVRHHPVKRQDPVLIRMQIIMIDMDSLVYPYFDDKIQYLPDCMGY